MRFTKVIRDYMEKTLNEKRMTVNKADPVTKAYEERRACAISEIDSIIDAACVEIQDVLFRYDMDEKVKGYDGADHDATGYILSIRENYVCNKNEAKARDERERSRYATQKNIMEQIELDCALGADKESFMTMLNNATFE